MLAPSPEGLKAGSKEDFSGSMAEAMEKAFQREWGKYMTGPLPADGAEYRRMLFAAIAQGVVRHLVDRARDAFDLDVFTTQVIGTGQHGTTGSTITSENKDSITITAGSGSGWQIPEGRAVVVQSTDSKVVSEGKATVASVRHAQPLYGDQ